MRIMSSVSSIAQLRSMVCIPAPVSLQLGLATLVEGGLSQAEVM